MGKWRELEGRLRALHARVQIQPFFVCNIYDCSVREEGRRNCIYRLRNNVVKLRVGLTFLTKPCLRPALLDGASSN